MAMRFLLYVDLLLHASPYLLLALALLMWNSFRLSSAEMFK